MHIAHKQVQTDDILDANINMALNIEERALILKPFVNKLDPSLLMNTYSQTNKSLRFETEIDEVLAKLYHLKFKDDLDKLNNNHS